VLVDLLSSETGPGLHRVEGSLCSLGGDVSKLVWTAKALGGRRALLPTPPSPLQTLDIPPPI
jgi:hypothetical protein